MVGLVAGLQLIELGAELSVFKISSHYSGDKDPYNFYCSINCFNYYKATFSKDLDKWQNPSIFTRDKIVF